MCCFFFKQKTAYEMRISDWSSDVCSSDLLRSGSACRFRQFGNESQRNAQLVELVMRAQECDRLVGAGLARDLRDFDACLAQRPLRLGLARKSVVSGKSVSVRVDLGGRRIIIKKKNHKVHEIG